MAAKAAIVADVMEAMQTAEAAKMEALAEVSRLRDETTTAQVSPYDDESSMHTKASSGLLE